MPQPDASTTGLPSDPRSTGEAEPATTDQIEAGLQHAEQIALQTLKARRIQVQMLTMELRQERAKSDRLQKRCTDLNADLDRETVAANEHWKKRKAAERDLAAATSNLGEMTEDRDNCLAEVRDYHFEYGKEECPECNGSGDRVDIGWGHTSDPTAESPPEIEVLVEKGCEECRGSGKSWGI